MKDGSEDFDAYDLEWLASDSNGHVAVFTVAGGGPMPTACRNWRILDLTTDFIRGLPVRTTADLLVTLPRPVDYVSFAERGLFAYDWISNRGRYEIQARPREPAGLSALCIPENLANAIWRVKGTGSFDIAPVFNAPWPAEFQSD